MGIEKIGEIAKRAMTGIEEQRKKTENTITLCKNYLQGGQVEKARELALELTEYDQDPEIMEFFKNQKPEPAICEKCGAEIEHYFDKSTLEYKKPSDCQNCKRLKAMGEIRENLPEIMTGQGIGRRFLNANLDDFPKQYRNIGENSAFIYGPRGVGKTHLTAAVMRDLILKIDPLFFKENIRNGNMVFNSGAGSLPLFRSVPELLLEIRRTYNQSSGYDDDESMLIDRYGNHPVLILDDLGAEKSTDWARATLYLIINRRYEEERKTFITSNLDLDGIKEHLDSRISSRLAELCKVYKLVGADRRKAKLKK